tara:strand:- start:159 stop:488 length:330 start_codon:yes stop_codon:yes gene_type:complete
MKLTGKCKEDFDKWYVHWVRNQRNDYHKYVNDVLLSKFYREVNSMQYGVYLDFFDSVGIYMDITPIINDASERMYQVYEDENHIISCDTRQEARAAAIEKANEIYNNED